MAKIRRSRDAGLTAAIKAMGGIKPFARALGISHPALIKWRRVPAHRIIEVERVTGVPRERLRPDLYRK